MPADAPDREDTSSETTPPRATASGPLPLSRNASRALVIVSFLLAIGIAGGGTWFILSTARSGPPPQEAVTPADTVGTAAEEDTTAAPVP